jgi:hypothetical protein
LKNKICPGDSFILDTYWSCGVSPTYYDFEVYDGIIATTLWEDNHHKKYAFSFAGSGNVAFRFNYQVYTITVYDPLKQAELLAKTVFCKDDPPLALNTSNSKYKLDAVNITVIEPSLYTTGSYTLTEYADKGRFGCSFKVDKLITITEVCSLPQQILIYPNPATGYIIVPADEASRIRLIDMYGKVLAEKEADGTSTQINLEQLPAGVFVVEFLSNDKAQKVKVIHL